MFVQKDTTKQAHYPWICVAAPTKPILNLYLSEIFENGKESRISRIKSFIRSCPRVFGRIRLVHKSFELSAEHAV